MYAFAITNRNQIVQIEKSRKEEKFLTSFSELDMPSIHVYPILTYRTNSETNWHILRSRLFLHMPYVGM